MKLKVKKMHNLAKLPTDACFDLYSLNDYIINHNVITKIRTGIAIELPHGYEAIIRPKLSISAKGIHIFLTTINERYRGELIIFATLLTDKFKKNDIMKNYVFIDNGNSIAQLAIRKTPSFEIVEVDEFTEK